MSVKNKPEIRKAKSSEKDYTCVTFEPDFEKFGMDHGLDQDILDLMIKRVYDMAGCTDSSVRVYLNGDALPIKTFKDYVGLYLPDNGQTARVYSDVNER